MFATSSGATTLSSVMDDDLSKHCKELADPDLGQFAVSLFIFLGILISYIPQHYRIVANRSSAGISPYFVLLGTTSVSFALAYILALPQSRDDMACCRVNSSFSCFAGILGVGQIAIQWGCFWLILLLWLLFFPRATPFAPPRPLHSAPSYNTALVITCSCVVHALALAIVNLLLTSRYPDVLQWYANGLGLTATVLAVTQYLPQLWTTYKLKDVGSLSIATMCIQTPGSYVWAASLAYRLGWAGWSIWGLYCVTGTLQGMILALGTTYELRARRARKAGDVANNSVPSYGANGDVERQPNEDESLAEQRHEGEEIEEEEIRDESTPLLDAESRIRGRE